MKKIPKAISKRDVEAGRTRLVTAVVTEEDRDFITAVGNGNATWGVLEMVKILRIFHEKGLIKLAQKTSVNLDKIK